MTKKDLFFSIFLALLSVAFVSVSLAVILTNGKSAKWINRKMKIGALMLSLTLPTLSNAQEITCYDVVETMSITMTGESNDTLTVEKIGEIDLKGNISHREGKNFSFSIQDKSGRVVKSQNISALDGKFNDYNEDFEIKISEGLTPREYILYLYSVKKSQQNADNYIRRYNIKVIPSQVPIMCYAPIRK